MIFSTVLPATQIVVMEMKILVRLILIKNWFDMLIRHQVHALHCTKQVQKMNLFLKQIYSQMSSKGFDILCSHVAHVMWHDSCPVGPRIPVGNSMKSWKVSK